MDEDLTCSAMAVGEVEFRLNTNLPDFRPLQDLASPAKFLKRFQLSLDYFSVRNYLRCLTYSTLFLRLYQHNFPREFARSEAPLFIDPRSALNGGGDGFGAYSAREIEFFNLVNTRLFPINVDAILSESWEGERPDLIPIEYYGHGFDIDEPDYDSSRLGWQLLAAIFTDYGAYWDFQSESEENPTLKPYAKLLERLEVGEDDINFGLLNDLCQAEDADEELEYLTLSARVLNHITSNLFIDPDDMYPVYDAMWSDGQSTIDLLHKEHIEAHRIMADCDLLLDWIEADPKNFRKVIDVCNRSNSKKQPKKPRRRSTMRNGPSPVEHRIPVTV
jgi:hypothetical protein